MSVITVDFAAASRARFAARLAAMRRHPSNAARSSPPSGRAALNTLPGPNFPGDRAGPSLATGDTTHLDRGARRRARNGAERGAAVRDWEVTATPLKAHPGGAA